MSLAGGLLCYNVIMGTWKHRVMSINEEEGTLKCSNCGIVEIKWKNERARCREGWRESKRLEQSGHRELIQPHGPKEKPTDPQRLRLSYKKKSILREDKCCEICGSKYNLVVDHEHGTQIVRGILCHKCNVGLGMFCDNSFKLAGAINYLHSKQGL